MPPGYQAVQAAHAYVEFCVQHPDIIAEWHEISQYMCLLAVENEAELSEYYSRAIGAGIKCVAFYEPDRDYEMTAICLEPSDVAAAVCANLPLALR